MITLHKFVSAWDQPDLSPFCAKVETYLRMTAQPFRTVTADSRKAPKQKLPFIEDGGRVVSDSRDIVDYLESKRPVPLDADLSPRERAIATAFRGLLEEELYFLVVVQRWQHDANWPTYLPILREYGTAIGVPKLLMPVILRAVRKQMVQSVWGQGAGRHSAEQVDDRIRQILDAVSIQLGDGPYFLGARLRVIDATVYAFLSSLLDSPFDSSARRHGLSFANLTLYRARMKSEFFAAAGSPRPAAAV
jgi:glutathione S-transferase